MTEAPYGSVGWFAGMFWLTLAVILQETSRGVFAVRNAVARTRWDWLRTQLSTLCIWLLTLSDKCSRTASKCAIEAGAEE